MVFAILFCPMQPLLAKNWPQRETGGFSFHRKVSVVYVAPPNMGAEYWGQIGWEILST